MKVIRVGACWLKYIAKTFRRQFLPQGVTSEAGPFGGKNLKDVFANVMFPTRTKNYRASCR